MISFEHKGFSGLINCLGAGAVLPGIMERHPLGSDLFSQILEHKAANGDIGCLRPRSDLSVNFTINYSMLVDIYEHEHYLNLRITYGANIWEGKQIFNLVSTFTDVLPRCSCLVKGV